MNATVTYLTNATPMPCAPTRRVSIYAAVSEGTRETADIALVRLSLHTSFVVHTKLGSSCNI